MDIMGCQVAGQEVKVLGNYCFYLGDQRRVEDILFDYFLELYGIEEVLDSRLMFYDDYNMNNYYEIFETDFEKWLGIMNNYFLDNMKFICTHWNLCRNNFIGQYSKILN